MQNVCRQSSKETCEGCKAQQNGFLCHLMPEAAREFEGIKTSCRFREGFTLFLENEDPRGIFIVCSGQVKLSVSSRGGKTLVLQIAQPGEVIGLSASMSGLPYEVTAETLYPSQLAFIRRDDFLSFVNRFPEAHGSNPSA